MRLGRIIRWSGLLVMAAAMGFWTRNAVSSETPDPVHARQDAPTRPDWHSASDFGGVGLLQTPTARFGPDGMIWTTAGYLDPYQRYTINWHVLPWAEIGFRYTAIGGGNVADAAAPDDGSSFNDQGFDIKIRLRKETKFFPAIAVGLQDATGSGHFSSEYLVASKRYFDFDFSLGLAWGYLGNRGGIGNPMRPLFGASKSRNRNAGEGGTFQFGDYFEGDEIGLFGGVEWRTPITGLSLKLELDGNDYRNEPRNRKLDQSLPVNIGLNYRPGPWFDAVIGFERGNRVMARVALRADLAAISLPRSGDDVAQGLRPRPPQAVAQAALPAKAMRMAGTDAAIGHLFDELYAAGFALQQLDFDHVQAVVHLVPANPVPDLAQIRKAAKAVFDVVPTPLRQVTVVGVYAGGSRQLARFSLGDIRRDAGAGGIADPRMRADPDGRSAMLPSRMANAGYAADGAPANHLGRLGSPVPVPPRLAATIGGSPPLPYPLPRRDPTTAVAGGSADPAQTGAASAARHARIAERIFAALADGDMAGGGFVLDELTAVAYVTPKRYRPVVETVGRAARIVANNVPASVEQITIVIVERGMEVSRVSLWRGDLERAVAARGSPEEIWANAVIERGQARRLQPLVIRNPRRYPAYDWALEPRLRQHFGGSDSFYNYQVWAALGGSVSPLPGLRLAGTLGADIVNDFDDLDGSSAGTLRRVRSDVAEYVRQGDVTIAELFADYTYSPRPDWFVKGAAGIFEQMYGGLSGEVLYRPFDKRWALGLELNWLGQREFDQLLTFRDYDVVTGHASLYYHLPAHNLDAQVHIGRYLARDVGATFQLARHFDNGVAIGGYVTFTDASSKEFGEGSFDKGFFVTVPLGPAVNKPMRQQTTTVEFRPLTRDGGQRATIPGRLYELTRPGSYGAITRHWYDLLE